MSKKLVVTIVIILILIAGLGVGVLLVQQSQIFHEKASVPTGQTTVSISPATGTYNLGQIYPISIYFNTAGIPISAIAVRLTYPYSGANPEIIASGVTPASALISTGDWSCPVKSVSSVSGTVQIDISCINTNTSGFSASTDTLLATFNINAGAIPLTNPTLITFDPNQSIITQKSSGQDVLLTPSGVASIRVAGATTVPTSTSVPSLAPTADFTADSYSIRPGQCTNMHWRTQNATSVNIDGNNLAVNGDRQICPTVTTTYSLRASNGNQSQDQTRNFLVQVSIAAPTATATATGLVINSTSTPTITPLPISTTTTYLYATATPVVTTVTTTTIPTTMPVPVTGVETPTIIAIGVAVFLLFGAVFLAL